MVSHISTLDSDVAAVRAKVELIFANYVSKDALGDCEHRLSTRIEEVRNALHLKFLETKAALAIRTGATQSTLEIRMAATQSDLEVRISATRSALELQIANGFAAHKFKLAQLKRDISDLRSALKTWFPGTAIAMLVGSGGMSVALFNAMKP